MLEYMLARAEDQTIIQKSKGKLKWIVLDEAHSLVGAAAAEIALLLRRVLIAFETRPEEVHFVATSATIGSGTDVHKQLKRFLADVAGIAAANVHVVEGHRQLPARSHARGFSGSLREDMSPSELYDTLSADDRVWNFVSDKLFRSAQPLGEFERVGRSIGVTADRFLELLSTAARPGGSPGEVERLAPMRIHSFERAVPGVWSCLNPRCGGSPEGWPFGAVLLDRCDVCPTCEAMVFEIISCVECGTPMLEAAEDIANDRLLPASRKKEKDEFEFEASRDAEDAGDTEENDDGSELSVKRDILLRLEGGTEFRPMSVDVQTGSIKNGDDTDTVRVSYAEKLNHCPCCGVKATRGIDGLLRPLRFGAPFMIANAAPILLEGVDATSSSVEMPSSGRRVLSFTDSRQGTARMSAKIQAEAERNFVRSFIYHSVQYSMAAAPVAEIEAIEGEIRQFEEAYASTRLPALKDLIESRRMQLAEKSSGSVAGIEWKEMVDRLGRRTEVSRWLKEVWEPRDPELFHDTAALAEFLLLREFTRRPRKAMSLETLGFARLVFPAIETQTVVPSAFIRHGGRVEDWRAFLNAVITIFIRSNGAIGISYGLMHWINPKARLRSLVAPKSDASGDRRFLVWPLAPRHGKVMSGPQWLLVNGLKLNISDPGHRADIEECLSRAWQQLQPLLGSDPERRALDFKTARIAPLANAFQCPDTRRVVDVAPFGISPLSRASHRTDAIPIEMPQHPSPIIGAIDASEGRALVAEWLEHDERIASLRERGLWNNISDRVSLFADYARSAEHSAQQQSGLLRTYEDKFKKGEINILNCSTTMEMGVDIGSVSTVMMTNVPPSVASYRQRVGRAGRRGQPYSLAFTFCRDRPLDRETFATPARYLERTVAAPRVALNSRPIVQRHVNALLFRQFILERGGDAIKMEIGGFFGCPSQVGEKRLPQENRPIALFKEWLGAPSTIQSITPDIEKLVRHSVLEGETVLADTCRQIVSDAESTFVSEWEGLQALARDEGVKEAGRSRMGMELRRLCDEFLLGALADRGFLPGHGFPTGVVTFLPHRTKSDEAQPLDGGRQSRLTGPQRSLDLAIRDYAPGSEVVLDGLVHRSAGVLLNWKRPASESNIRDVQSLKFHWTCGKCGTSDTSRQPALQCGGCGSNVLSVQYLRPSGFSVDSRERAHADTDMISYVAPEEPAVSARGIEWISLPMPDKGRFRSSREGLVYYSNRGASGNGYALCLHCGRAEPDNAPTSDGVADLTTPSPLAAHKPLRWKKGENTIVCEGNDTGWKTRRNLELGYEIITDVFELQPSKSLTKAAATALVIAMREAVARSLGVEADEMGYSVHSSAGLLGQRCQSLMVFDRCAGGAGFAASIADRIHEVLKDVRTILNCTNPGCVTGCASCVLTSDAPIENGTLDRKAALNFVEEHLSFSDGLPAEDKFTADAQISISVIDEIDKTLRAANKPLLKIYLPPSFDAASLSSWPLVPHLERWTFQGYPVRLVMMDELRRSLDAASMLSVSAFAQYFAKPGTPYPLETGQTAQTTNGSYIGAVVVTPDQAMGWGSRDLSAWLPTMSWGQPQSHPIGFGTGLDVPISRALSPDEFRPRPTAKFAKIGSELDRPLTLFGESMASRIRALMVEIGVPKDADVEMVRYSDPYVRSPLVGKLFIDTIASLTKKNANRASIQLHTGAPSSERYPSRLGHDWQNPSELVSTLTEYASLKQLDLDVKVERVAHGRYLHLILANKDVLTVVLDQGFGAWQLTSTGSGALHDFRATPKRQAEAMLKASGGVAKSGIGNTYLVATRD